MPRSGWLVVKESRQWSGVNHVANNKPRPRSSLHASTYSAQPGYDGSCGRPRPSSARV